jgi:hypothetical protein
MDTDTHATHCCCRSLAKLPLLSNLQLQSCKLHSTRQPPSSKEGRPLLPSLARLLCDDTAVLNVLMHCTEVGRPPVQLDLRGLRVLADKEPARVVAVVVKGCSTGWLSSLLRIDKQPFQQVFFVMHDDEDVSTYAATMHTVGSGSVHRTSPVPPAGGWGGDAHSTPSLMATAGSNASRQFVLGNEISPGAFRQLLLVTGGSMGCVAMQELLQLLPRPGLWPVLTPTYWGDELQVWLGDLQLAREHVEGLALGRRAGAGGRGGGQMSGKGSVARALSCVMAGGGHMRRLWKGLCLRR